MGYDMRWRQASEEEHGSGADYFRLNIWGMQICREVMADAGMAEWVDLPPEPKHTNFAIADEDIYNYDDPSVAAFWDAHRAWLNGSHGAHGIPLHKLCSNDGWLVTPEEINQALESAPQTATFEGETVDFWPEWIAWLQGAARHGGFEVW